MKTITAEKIDTNKECWFTICYGCKNELVYNALEKKKSTKLICPICNSTITMRHMASGQIKRKWEAAKEKK